MDMTLTNIVTKAGLSFRNQYDVQDDWNRVVYKFVPDSEMTDAARKSLVASIKAALDAAKFPYNGIGFQKAEASKGDDYWALAITVLSSLRERALDRDEHGNLIYVRTKKRAA